MRKTKIICTIGPRTCKYDQLEKLAEGGMNIARLNISHGSHEWHRKVIKHIHKLNEKGQHSIAVMLDTKGPEVRSGDLVNQLKLSEGDEFIFTVRREPEYPKNTTEVSYDGFIDDVKVGDIILVDGGIISFKVKEKIAKDIICECQDGGTLSSRRHLNIRGKSVKLPSITEKDWKDIDFGIKEGVDFIALSFVKTAGAVKELKTHLNKKKSSIKVVAKIESAASIPYLEPIIKAADGVMVARGDLGAELPFEDVPLIQSEITKLSRFYGKPVIVATHLLESMIIHPTPTRAEVTDIAQAVKERADAVMLSGETTTGKYPFKALVVMDKVARRMEQKMEEEKKISVPISDGIEEQIVMNAAQMGNNIEADSILVFTRRGFMASLLSRCRPNSPIYAFTDTLNVRRKLNLFWGIKSFHIKFFRDPEKTIQCAFDLLKNKKLSKKDHQAIIVSDILAGEEVVDTIQVRTINS
jgi:pyruvate kinase